MSLNLRKRPSNTLENNNSKRPRLGEKTESSIEDTDEKKDPLDELTPRGDDLEELQEEEIKTTEESEEESSDDSSEEYSDFEEEMMGLKESDPEAYESLQKVHKELERTEPNVYALLKTPLRLEDRAKLCQFYEIYKSTEPNTLEWLDARMRYNAMFKEYKLGYKQHSKFTYEEHDRMKEEEKKLSNYDPQLTLKYKILNLDTSRENKAVIYRRYEELMALDSCNEEYNKLKHWLTWATSIPHDKIKEIEVNNITEFIQEASRKLDEELFGMKKVKEQILLFISAKLTNPSMKRSNLGLVGAPGTGKTAVARMIAKLMNWGFEQISFGGVDKADFLKGHEYTYVGAQPGAIVKCLKRMGHKNGVIFLDELEKAAEHPDVRAALLHLVDQSQNQEFRDNFLGEITVDLSHIWYVGSMNKIPTDNALADRWWIVKVKGYTDSEKSQIIERYLLPKALKNLSKAKSDVTMSESARQYLIRRVSKTEDKGVRTIQKTIEDIVNKIDFLVTHQDKDGNLPFSTTFKLGMKLSYPVKVSSKMIDRLVKNKELNTMLNMMYL